MNQGFRLRFDQMRENAPTPTPSSSVDGSEMYAQIGHTRNVCLAWPDGRRMFFNYAYLIAASFEPNGEYNSIQLDFSSHTVGLKGYRLVSLFMALLDQLPRLIQAIDVRYMQDEERADYIVITIQVENKN